METVTDFPGLQNHCGSVTELSPQSAATLVTDEDEQVQSSVLVQGQAAYNLRACIFLYVGGVHGEEFNKPL